MYLSSAVYPYNLISKGVTKYGIYKGEQIAVLIDSVTSFGLHYTFTFPIGHFPYSHGSHHYYNANRARGDRPLKLSFGVYRDGLRYTPEAHEELSALWNRFAGRARLRVGLWRVKRRARMRRLHEELVAAVWNPARMEKLIAAGLDPLNM